ncbi:MAG TPA: EamA family transporter [Candidatus Sulfomarinibacteraceae bacterium]|nr:EamA family transporter [Candidatus Sulfomarinibacteraceae bacterium]
MSQPIEQRFRESTVRDMLAQLPKLLLGPFAGPGRDSHRLTIIASFAAVYFFWGSTYLAIHYAIETIPPFLMAGIRFLAAGAILYGWSRFRGAPRPGLIHLRTATITGGLMFLAGNGVLGWAEQFVPTGLAALLVATVPLWVVVLTAIGDRRLPSRAVTAGVLMGLAGILLLVGPGNVSGGRAIDQRMAVLGAVAIVFAALAWAVGTLYSRRSPRPTVGTMAIALDLLAGAVLLFLFAALNGEWARFAPDSVSLKSWLAVAYLVVFGSLIGYSAYMWLVRETTPTQASSNFYVNPVVAVILGWLLAGELLTPRMLVAATIIVTAVALIVTRRNR